METDICISRNPWWQDARFGMFIHFGLPTILGRGIWAQYWEHIPRDEYASYAKLFAPKHYRPAEWVALARDAGMKYVVLTSRNHDGFCLFDTKTTDFNATRGPAGRDLLAEFADACHAAEMRMGFYYSLMSWRHAGCLQRDASQYREPEFYKSMVDEAHEQVRELTTNYGRLDILWFDCMRPGDPSIWRSEELVRMTRKNQPGILVNDRAGVHGDFGTPENETTAQSGPWEACFTMTDTWGHAPGDRNWKTSRELVNLLMSCAARSGNLILNLPPDGDGRFPAEGVDRLRDIGRWMNANGEAIHGTTSAPIGHAVNIIGPGQGWATMRGNVIYLAAVRWQGSTFRFGWLRNRVISARVLGTNYEARVEQEGDRVWLHDLPEYAPDPLLSIIAITVDGSPERVEPSDFLVL
jgi:alpha-L-fucosidase